MLEQALIGEFLELDRVEILPSVRLRTEGMMLIGSTRIVQPQAMMLIIFSLIILSVITLALVILASSFFPPWLSSSRGILSPSPLALFHHLVQIRNRPYLNRSQSILKAW